MKLSKTDNIEIIENSISWIIVFGMFLYGFGKTVQFDVSTEIKKTIPELSGQELMWAFYGYSKTYALIIGLLEIIGGVLILIKKTRLIGCLFISFILTNIIIQDILFSVVIGALKAAIFYQLMILIILCLNYKKVIESIKSILVFNKASDERNRKLLKYVIAFFIFIVLRIFEYFVTIRM